MEMETSTEPMDPLTPSVAALAVQPEGGSGASGLLSWRVFALECDAEFPRSGKLSLSTVGF